MAQETVKIPPLADIAVTIPGKFFAVLSCNAPFLVEFDQGGRQLVDQGSRLSFEQFNRIVFTETSGESNTVIYFVGDAQYDGSIPTQKNGAMPIVDAPTFDIPYLMPPTGTVLTISGSVVTLLPVIVNGKTRKSFHIVSQTDSPLGIFATTGELLDILTARDERTFYFSTDINIKGTSGSVDVAIYYTLYS